MALDSHYIPAFTLETVFLDKDSGAPLSGGILTFYEDDNRTVPKSVFQLTGTPPTYSYLDIGPTITLSSIGTCAVGDDPFVPYLFPYDDAGDVQLYYMTVTSSAGTAQFAREAIPYIAGSGTEGGGNNIENELSNPQFSEVLFGETGTAYAITLASSTSLPVGPNWYLDLVGSGTVTLTQLALVAGTVSTNPPYALDIALSGFTGTAVLRQRLQGNASIFTGNWLNGFFVAKSTGATADLSLQYSQSSGAPSGITIASGTAAVGTYAVFRGSVELDSSTNTNTAPNGYADISLIIPNASHITVTSVQVYGSDSEVTQGSILFDEQPLNRLTDHMYNYWQQPLFYKRISSYLVGWDFAFNPYQVSVATVTPTAGYIFDQTIAKSTGGNYAVTFSNVNPIFTPGTANTAMYLLQYLTGASAAALEYTALSVNIHAYLATGTASARVYLFGGNAVSTIPVLPTTIGTMDASGVFTLTAANWFAIASTYYRSAAVPILGNDVFQIGDTDLGFANFNVFDNLDLTTISNFAIVVTIATGSTASAVQIGSISLVPGTIPTRPAPQTADEVLRECQYYYEKSYNPTVAVGTSTLLGALFLPQSTSIAGANATRAYSQSGSFIFNTRKRIAPTVASMRFYSLLGVADNVTVTLVVNTTATQVAADAANGVIWNYVLSMTGFAFDVVQAQGGAIASDNATANGGLRTSGYLTFHYVADCRLGII